MTCASCAHMSPLREPVPVFGALRTGVCTVDGARPLLVGDLFGTLCASCAPRSLDFGALLTDEEE